MNLMLVIFEACTPLFCFQCSPNKCLSVILADKTKQNKTNKQKSRLYKAGLLKGLPSM